MNGDGGNGDDPACDELNDGGPRVVANAAGPEAPLDDTTRPSSMMQMARSVVSRQKLPLAPSAAAARDPFENFEGMSGLLSSSSSSVEDAVARATGERSAVAVAALLMQMAATTDVSDTTLVEVFKRVKSNEVFEPLVNGELFTVAAKYAHSTIALMLAMRTEDAGVSLRHALLRRRVPVDGALQILDMRATAPWAKQVARSVAAGRTT